MNELLSLMEHKAKSDNYADLMAVVEFIESLDMSDHHYSFEKEGEKASNFLGFSVSIENNYCNIFINFLLDPSEDITFVKGIDKKHAMREAFEAFFKYLKENYIT